MKTNRLMYIDRAKGIGMLFILLQHISSTTGPMLRWGNSFKILIFYMISGSLIGRRYNRSENAANARPIVETVVRKRLKSLGIPYLLVSLVAAVLAVLVGLKKGGELSGLLFRNGYAIVSLKGISTLWFLPTLFLAELLYCLLYPIWKDKRGALVLLVVSMAMTIGIGYLFADWSLLVSDKTSDILIAWPICALLKSIVAFTFFFWAAELAERLLKLPMPVLLLMLAGGIMAAELNRGADLNSLRFGTHPVLFVVSGLLNSVAILGLFKRMEELWNTKAATKSEKKHAAADPLAFIGINSLFLMCTHLPLYMVQTIDAVLGRVFGKVNMEPSGAVFVFVAFVILMATEVVLLAVWKKVGGKKVL